MARSYKTVEEIITELELLIDEMRASGVKVLPSERHLAKRTGTSVMTLRKALNALEKRRLFVKSNRVRMLSNDSSNEPAIDISVAFIAPGDTAPSNVEWLRLSFMLSEKLRQLGIGLRTICFNHEDTIESINHKLTPLPGVIILADAPFDAIRARILSLKNKSLIIATDENYIGKCESVVSLNNYQAGYLAAETLIKAGCQRPAMNYNDKGYTPFYRRRDGFIDALAAAGKPIENCAFKTKASYDNNPNALTFIETVEKVCSEKHDGFFLFSDGQSMQAREIISRHYKIPEEFRLITIDATGECKSEKYSVTSISHATDGVASKIVDNIVAYAKGENFEKITLVDSKLMGGDTV